MAKDEDREYPHRHRPRAAPPATTFAGNIMAMMVLAMLFDDDEDRPNPEDEAGG
jgi:hypothetical protein